MGFAVATLGITIGFQAFQPEFVNIEWVLPIYWMMFVVFSANAAFLFFFDQIGKIGALAATLFLVEAAYITVLIFYTGVNYSIFLLLYLVNIILCGFVFQRKGAILLATATSMLFSVVNILSPELKGQTLLFAIGLNNLAFFAVAYLSGVLSEQINFMGREVQEQGRSIQVLRNLNQIVVDNIATGLVTFDRGGRILQANSAAGEVLDYPVNDLLGENIEQYFPRFLSQVQALSEVPEESPEDRAVARFDYEYVDPDQNRRVLGCTISALQLDGQIDGFILTFQDFTKVRRLEFAMRQSEKMAAIGQLAAGIAHEIRNPLASISGSIQLLAASLEKPSSSEEGRLMNIMVREIDRLNNLITEFLDFVRPDAQRNDPVDLNQLLQDLVEFARLNRAVRADISVEFELGATQVIRGNRDKLKQALLNIVINAFQAMNDTPSARLRIRSFDRADWVIVQVRDSGVGIEARNLKKIFEPFHTTKPKGTGLGLAVTHKIIENHSGRIFVESEKGVGTEFIIELPVKVIDPSAVDRSKKDSDDFQTAFKGQKRNA
jgi:two-component system sensor histidine kinase PilS (NtrC family)